MGEKASRREMAKGMIIVTSGRIAVLCVGGLCRSSNVFRVSGNILVDMCSCKCHVMSSRSARSLVSLGSL